eukprot:COSAG06_NODE_23135_length_701_cov_3.534884_2_plen_171_part_01
MPTCGTFPKHPTSFRTDSEQRSSRRKSASPDPNVSPIPETPSPTPREQPRVPSASRRDSAALALLSSGEPPSPSAIRRAIDESARPSRRTSTDTRVAKSSRHNPMSGVRTPSAVSRVAAKHANERETSRRIAAHRPNLVANLPAGGEDQTPTPSQPTASATGGDDQTPTPN